MGVIVFFLRIKWQELFYFLDTGQHHPMPAAKMMKNIIRDYAIIALGVCIYIIGDYRKKQTHNEQLIKSKAEAEIKLLKGQLHPHFLFNSLNNIYSLALIKSDLTADSILKLTELLDYLVYRANMDKVTLSREVQLLLNYIELEKLRYGDKLRIATSIMIKNEWAMVTPLILLPFAENCFKHGGTGADGIFRIHIELHADEAHLGFLINNSKKVNQEKSPVNGGVGLKNIRQRLHLFYPGKHQLKIIDAPDHYSVSLEIQYRNGEL